MRALLPALATLAAALLLPAARLAAQQPRAPATLVVTVADDSTGLPVEGARVSVVGQTGSVPTASDGHARLRGLPPGSLVLRVAQPGYEMKQEVLTLEPGQAREVAVRLVPQVEEVVLEGLTVTSWGRSTVLRRQGFYDRQRMGAAATYITADELEAMHPFHLIDVFRRVRGFNLVQTSFGSEHVLVTTRTQSRTSGQCTPDLFLNGTLVRAADALHAISWETVEGIEAYPTQVSVPSQYNRQGASCGVVLIWTK